MWSVRNLTPRGCRIIHVGRCQNLFNKSTALPPISPTGFWPILPPAEAVTKLYHARHFSSKNPLAMADAPALPTIDTLLVVASKIREKDGSSHQDSFSKPMPLPSNLHLQPDDLYAAKGKQWISNCRAPKSLVISCMKVAEAYPVNLPAGCLRAVRRPGKHMVTASFSSHPYPLLLAPKPPPYERLIKD